MFSRIWSLTQIKDYFVLAKALQRRVVAVAWPGADADAEQTVRALPLGGVALLENVRFYPGEETNDRAFAQALARLGDVYVNDAFSVTHRAHASTEALAHLLPAAAGRSLQAELEALDKALNNPVRPLAAIVGGAKVSTKLDLLRNLVRKVNVLALGGAMANTFLMARGFEVGISLCRRGMANSAQSVMERADQIGCGIVLPDDVVIAQKLEAGVSASVVSGVPADHMILDIGPTSAARFATRLVDFRTLVWNDPLGAFEVPPFDAATAMVAKAIGSLSRGGGLLSVAGGGETVAALGLSGVAGESRGRSTA